MPFEIICKIYKNRKLKKERDKKREQMEKCITEDFSDAQRLKESTQKISDHNLN